MTEDNDKVVVVRHHIITEEVRPLPQQKSRSKEGNKEDDKFCWTRIKEAKNRNGTNTTKCLSEVLQILLESCKAFPKCGGAFVLFIIENLIGIVFLILGIVFLNDCPIQKTIPISLIVWGVVSIIHGMTIQLVGWKCVDLDKKKDGFTTFTHLILLITSVIQLFAIFIACYLVFHIYGKVKTGEESKGTDEYCHPFLYWFAFWYFLIMAIIGFILLFLLCCLFCFIVSGADPNHQPPQYIVVERQSKPDNRSNESMQSGANNQALQPNAGPQQPNAGGQPPTNPPPVAQ